MTREAIAFVRQAACWTAVAVTGLLGVPATAEAQFTVRDFVVTAGGSAEGYRGNLPTVGSPVTDSAEVVSAFAGELALRTNADYRSGSGGTFLFSFDGGVRQFNASGFEQRDYSPREWVGTLDLGYGRALSETVGFRAHTRIRGRELEDRPPMPLFLQPGYRAVEGSLVVDFDGPRGVVYDVELTGAKTDFFAPAFAPQVRLLDREGVEIEAGAVIASGASTLRIFAGVQASRYPKQETFAPEDPFRSDRTFQGGVSWTRQAGYLLQIELDARANRSNSLRPEYDAFTLRALYSTSLPRELSLSLYGAYSVKQYLHASEFARLLPGEEADNASLAYVSLSRSLAMNLDGTFRVGWTRAETEIGDAYFQRFGGSFALHYRPSF
ncbi:MAG: hypothetical protein WD056_00720 [Gemmatimonadota bacterium]